MQLLPADARAQDDWSLTRSRTSNRSQRSSGAARARKRTGTSRSSPQQRQHVFIARYRRILATNPMASVALARLLSIYRERDGNIEKLLDEVEQEFAADPTNYSALILLGHIYAKLERNEQARNAYQRASALRRQSPDPWLALAKLEQNSKKPRASRVAYEKAFGLTKNPAGKEDLLRELVSLSLDERDFAAAKAFHEKLIGKHPRSLYLATEYARMLAESKALRHCRQRVRASP